MSESKEATKPAAKGPHFGWKHIAPRVFECEFEGIKLHVEEAGGKWTFWVRRPGRGLIVDGVYYGSHVAACDAAEDAALDSLAAHVA